MLLALTSVSGLAQSGGGQTQVTVTLSGPTELWVETDGTFQAEAVLVTPPVGGGEEGGPPPVCSSTVTWTWSCPGAVIVSGGGASDVTATIRYPWPNGVGQHTVSVTATQTFHYADGSSQTYSGSDSVDVDVCGPGPCSASLALFKDQTLTTPAGSPLGGTVYPVLYVNMGPGCRVKPTEGGHALRITDLYDDYWYDPDVDFDIPVDFGTGWEVQVEGGWTAGSPTTHFDDEVWHYRHKMTWDSVHEPLGNNGPHEVAMREAVEYEQWLGRLGWQNPTGMTPDPLEPEAENVYVTGVTATEGNVDYFKWDPEAGGTLADPVITFTIVDADPHKYEWIIWYRETANGPTWVNGAYYGLSGVVDGTGTVTVHLADESTYGSGAISAGGHARGPYTYDVAVIEFTGDNPPPEPSGGVDSYYFKSPYALTVDWHEAEWFFNDPSFTAQIRVKYRLEHAEGIDAQEIVIVPMDPALDERSGFSGPCEVDVDHVGADVDGDDEPDGLVVYEAQQGDRPGTWWVVWTGSDESGIHSANRRTHDAQRMMMTNGRPENGHGYVIVGAPYGTALPSLAGTIAESMSNACVDIMNMSRVWIDTQIGDFNDPTPAGHRWKQGSWADAVRAAMANSMFFHFYGHGVMSRDVHYQATYGIKVGEKITEHPDGTSTRVVSEIETGWEHHWAEVTPEEEAQWNAEWEEWDEKNPPKEGETVVKRSVTAASWAGDPVEMQNAHLQGCSTGIGERASQWAHGSIAEWFTENGVGARSSLGTRAELEPDLAPWWVSMYYDFAGADDNTDGDLDNSLEEASELACEEMQRLHWDRPDLGAYGMLEEVAEPGPDTITVRYEGVDHYFRFYGFKWFGPSPIYMTWDGNRTLAGR